MKLKRKIGITVLGMVVAATTFAAKASAECGNLKGLKLQQQSWQGGPNRAWLLMVHDRDFDEPIVGFWKVTLTAKGNDNPELPDGAIIDNGFSQWHSDGTEILNSSRAPVTQSFCLGVWKAVGEGRYKLNHFAISWDMNNNLVGPANIREQIALAPSGNRYTGTFTLTQYDQAGNVLVRIVGVVNGTRITVSTPASKVF